ncbi:MAG: TonB-dependent receptor [Tannerellaceae bacterium]|jgi:TonB-linked SusC/RagA family outer membrane protein|nr:TonB-dependent receptor [Tannerellaceae bacterium]
MKKLLYILCLLVSLCISLQAQKTQAFVMEGIVYDETGESFPGVSVYLKSKLNIGGTITDSNGSFVIKAERGDVIIFSFVGYENVELFVEKEMKTLRVQFSQTARQLEEVVVVGLGTQRKISTVAAVSTLDPSQLQVPATSIANLLGGKVAGVISMQTSGEPGQNISEFWVRGIGTFGASSGALVLIDGLEGDINSIDPADIESFSILKDASATAVYGVRGANGVVLITTKRGQDGRLSITGRANWSLSHLQRVPEYLRAYDYAGLVNEAMEVRGEKPRYSNIEMDIIREGLDLDLYPDINWQDEILNKNSFKQTYYVSARGGGTVARYFISLGGSSETGAYRYDKESPYASNVGYDTYSFRTNIDLDLTKNTRLYFGTDGFMSIRNEPGMANTDYIWAAQSQINPLMLPIRYSNGQLPGGGANEASSPYVQINYVGKASRQQFKGKFTISVDQNLSMILDGLKIRAQGAYDIQPGFTERRYIQPALYQALSRNVLGELVTKETVKKQDVSYSKTMSQYRKYHLESTLNYEHLFGSNHRVSGLVYYYISDSKNTNDANSSLTAIPVRYQGISSRFTYSLCDTYMMDVNFGYTGSENFMPGKQYGFFPSIAAGWVPTSYQYMKDNVKWLNFFKIRASYGSVGNDRITSTRFPYLTLVNLYEGRTWGSTSDIELVNEQRVGADNLEWEKALKADIGIEGQLLNGKLSFVADIFNDQRNGIFQQRVQVPDFVGVISMPYGNIGKMRSYGSDGNISYIYEPEKDISFTLRANYTYARNEVQRWEQAYQIYPYQEYNGYPNGTIRGYKAIGLFKDEDDVKFSPSQAALGSGQMPGDIKYMDINGDGQITSDDRIPLSYNTYPSLMYGFGGEVKYKQFTIGILFKGTGKTDYYHVGQTVSHNNMRYSNGMGYVPFQNGQYGNVLSLIADPSNRWIPADYAAEHGIDPSLAENPDARFPRLTYGSNSNNSQLSDFWKGDARYLRLQEITVNYNLKKDCLHKMGISSIDFQLVGANLYVWDKVKLFDPEQAHFNGRVYPIPAVYTLQVYINL